MGKIIEFQDILKHRSERTTAFSIQWRVSNTIAAIKIQRRDQFKEQSHKYESINQIHRAQQIEKTQRNKSKNEWCTLEFTADDPSLLKYGGGAMQLQTTILLWSFFLQKNELCASRTATLRDLEEQLGTVNGKNTEPDIETMIPGSTR